MSKDASEDTGGAKRPAEPLHMTEDDVAAMSGSRKNAAPVLRRMKAHSPAAATGRLKSEKAQPPQISRREMDGIRRARKATAKVRDRFTPSDVPSDPPGDAYAFKGEPGKAPRGAPEGQR